MAGEGVPEVAHLLPDEDLAPVTTKWSAGRLVGKVVATAAIGAACLYGGTHRWAPPSPPQAPNLLQDVAALIQKNVDPTDCGLDYVLVDVLNNDLGGHAGDQEGIEFKIKRRGGGLPIKYFILDVHSPNLAKTYRSTHFNRHHPNLWKFHLETGHEMNLHFSMREMDGTEKLPLNNFGITFLDLDTDESGSHHEFISTDSSIVSVARVGEYLEETHTQSGRLKFEAKKFGLGEDDPDSVKGISEEARKKAVRLIYNNVHEFEVTLNVTNHDTGIPRQISMMLHDPDNCKNPVQATAATSQINGLRSAAEDDPQDLADKSLAAKEKAEEAADEAHQKAEEAREEATQAKKQMHELVQSGKAAEAAQKEAVHDAKHAELVAKHQVEKAEEKEKEAKQEMHKVKDELKKEEHKEHVANAHLNKEKALEEKAEDKLEKEENAEQQAAGDKENLDGQLADLKAKLKDTYADVNEAVSEEHDAVTAWKKAEAALKVESSKVSAAQAATSKAEALSQAADGRVEKAEAEAKQADAKAEKAKQAADCAQQAADATAAAEENTKQELEKVVDIVDGLLSTSKLPDCSSCNE